MSLIVSLRSELLKTKRTASLYLCMIAAGVLPAIFLLEFCMGTLEPETLKAPWKAFFMQGTQAFGLVILPIYVILVCTLQPQLEYRNHTWKQVLAAPQPKARLYGAKFGVIHLYIALLVLSFSLFMLIAGGLAQLARPDVILFSARSDWAKLLTVIAKFYVAILGISAFQFWLGMRFKNFIASIGIGLALWMLAALLLFQFEWEHADKFPFAYPLFIVVPVIKSGMAFIAWGSVGYTVLFTLLGYIDFKNRIIKA